MTTHARAAPLMPPVYSADVLDEIARPPQTASDAASAAAVAINPARYRGASTVRELDYPGEWLRGWAAILLASPYAGIPPRVEILAGRQPFRRRRGGETTILGGYIPDRHLVRVWPEDDRSEALCTLVHELAHAWSPGEPRTHHGPLWRLTYRALFAYATGCELNVDRAYSVVREFGERDPEMKIDGRGDSWRATAIDLAVTLAFDQLQPTIARIEPADGTSFLVASCDSHTRTVSLDGEHGPASPSR